MFKRDWHILRYKLYCLGSLGDFVTFVTNSVAQDFKFVAAILQVLKQSWSHGIFYHYLNYFFMIYSVLAKNFASKYSITQKKIRIQVLKFIYVKSYSSTSRRSGGHFTEKRACFKSGLTYVYEQYFLKLARFQSKLAFE